MKSKLEKYGFAISCLKKGAQGLVIGEGVEAGDGAAFGGVAHEVGRRHPSHEDRESEHEAGDHDAAAGFQQAFQ